MYAGIRYVCIIFVNIITEKNLSRCVSYLFLLRTISGKRFAFSSKATNLSEELTLCHFVSVIFCLLCTSAISLVYLFSTEYIRVILMWVCVFIVVSNVILLLLAMKLEWCGIYNFYVINYSSHKHSVD